MPTAKSDVTMVSTEALSAELNRRNELRAQLDAQQAEIDAKRAALDGNSLAAVTAPAMKPRKTVKTSKAKVKMGNAKSGTLADSVGQVLAKNHKGISIADITTQVSQGRKPLPKNMYAMVAQTLAKIGAKKVARGVYSA